jgi:hypothetical protein
MGREQIEGGEWWGEQEQGRTGTGKNGIRGEREQGRMFRGEIRKNKESRNREKTL